MYEIICGDCLKEIITKKVSLSFLDPPFNQGKKYLFHDDNLPEEEYWEMMRNVCKSVYEITEDGGSVYFMQREKYTEQVLRVLRETGWTYQNLIIWKKSTSASAPSKYRHPKAYQIIVFSAKGDRAKTFNKLRIDPPLLPNQKKERENGMFVTDVWDFGIKELTSGYFAGNEPIRNEDGSRFHEQQSPMSLLTRIILTSSNKGDLVFDPFAGTGTTLCAAMQLNRNAIGIEIDPRNVEKINWRLNNLREEDKIGKYKKDYSCTEKLNEIWGEI